MILWKKDSDLYFTVTLKDENMIPINPTDKSFIVRVYTTNKKDYREASFDKLTNEFINCKQNESDPFKVDIFFEKPNLNTGRMMIYFNMRVYTTDFKDKYYDKWLDIKTDIRIIN